MEGMVVWELGPSLREQELADPLGEATMSHLVAGECGRHRRNEQRNKW